MQANRRSWVWVLAIMALSAPAFAGVLGPNLITISVAGDGKSASWALPVPSNFDIPADGGYLWSMPAPVQLMDGATPLATIQTFSMWLNEDPVVTLNFSVQNLLPTTNTFTFTSANLVFPAINNPDAFAIATVTLTDGSDPEDGASITGLQSGSKLYKASYNGGTDWAYLVSSFSSPTPAASERQPLAGRTTILGSVSSMQTQFKFDLSGDDQASGTSRFDLIPEPGSLSLLIGVGAMMMARRRMA